MSSEVQVREQTVNGRDVIVLTKEYGGETHELYVPMDQAYQVLFNLLATVNDRKEESMQHVLIRKNELGEL